MFGWPEETLEDMKVSAETCNNLGIHNVKLHNLHVLKNTELENRYHLGNFKPFEIDEYARYVAEFLAHLSPDIAVHRLAATASRWDELVAPQWTRHKMTNFQYMIDHLKKNNIYQGLKYEAP